MSLWPLVLLLGSVLAAPIRQENFTYPVRLVDGENQWAGRVEIWREGEWGAVCDDAWDSRDAVVVCRQIGAVDVYRPVTDGFFGLAPGRIWLDNVRCRGDETELGDCESDGWGIHDCAATEAAGVICRSPTTSSPEPVIEILDNNTAVQPDFAIRLGDYMDSFQIRLSGGRHDNEGRVDLIGGNGSLINFCGDSWSLKEAAVVCRQLGLGFAAQAVRSIFGDAKNLPTSDLLTGLKCSGEEMSLENCLLSPGDECEGAIDYSGGVTCADRIADLELDLALLQSSVYLHDYAMFYLQCAMEENCLAPSAYVQQTQNPGWYWMSRRLLRFSTRTRNIGSADFRPVLPKELWEWHQCHMHHHSMEVFSQYDILDPKTGHSVAEGHKASFCLEDNGCEPGVDKVYSCKNWGNQGISAGCWDEYLHDFDCQWIDITDVEPGQYRLKVSINPEFQVAEANYSNNAVICDLYYNMVQAVATGCSFTQP